MARIVRAGGSEPESASERAYRWTKERISDGALPGGELVSEGDVADQLGISRTPVREAFLRLSTEGLLRLYPKRGAVVVAVTPDEVRDVIEARLLLETWAFRRVAADGASRSLLTELRRLIGVQRKAITRSAGREFQEADRDFHHAVVEATGNAMLARFHASLRDRQVRMGSEALQADVNRARQIVAEHAELVAALEKGIDAVITETVEHHINGTMALLNLGPPPAPFRVAGGLDPPGRDGQSSP